VQNRYNLADRASEDVLEHCSSHGIGFIPWFPLAAGRLAQPGSVLDRIARERNATTGQIAIAWLLQRSAVILPIPGTSSAAHLEENAAASDIVLSEQECESLNEAGRNPG
jgi:pyridoxine 4-dehydrogenase